MEKGDHSHAGKKTPGILGPRRGRPSGVANGTTRDRIIEAAVEKFARVGLRETGMSQIAEAAGIRAPSIYNHFASKHELWIAAACATLDQITDALISIDEPSLSWRDRLQTLADHCICLYREDGVLQWFGLQIRLEIARNPVEFQIIQDHANRLDALFVDIGRHAIAVGDFRSDTDALLLGQMLRTYLMEGTSMNLMIDSSADRFVQIVKIFDSLIVDRTSTDALRASFSETPHSHKRGD